MIFSIVEQALIMLPLVMGAYLILSLLKLPDFSLESAYLFGAVAAFLMKGHSFSLVLVSSIGGGMAVGAITYFLNQLFRIPFLLAAIVTNGLFHGVTQYCLGTAVQGFHLALPIDEITLLSIIATFLVGLIYLLMRSQLGYSLAIYGNNPLFFHNHRISSCYVIFFGIMLGHGLAGISGFLFAQSNGFVDLTMNFGVILLCLTASMLGRLIVRLSAPTVLLPIVGILAYFLVQQMLLRVGLNLKYFNAFQALFIITIFFIGYRKQNLNLDHLGI